MPGYQSYDQRYHLISTGFTIEAGCIQGSTTCPLSLMNKRQHSNVSVLSGQDHMPTYPGELGAKIFEHVSKEAWQMWLTHQTMLINEYRLTPIEPKAREFLETEMEKFFFGEGSAKPQEYVTPDE